VEIQGAKEALANLQRKIPDAEAAQKIDQDCLILEREQKQLFEANRESIRDLCFSICAMPTKS